MEQAILKTLAKKPNSAFKDVWAEMKNTHAEFSYKDTMKKFYAMAKEEKFERTFTGKNGFSHQYSVKK